MEICHACMRAACGLPCAGALRCLWLPALRPHAKLCAYASSGNGMALSMAARGALNGGRLELSCNHLYMPAHACRKREYCEVKVGDMSRSCCFLLQPRDLVRSESLCSTSGLPNCNVINVLPCKKPKCKRTSTHEGKFSDWNKKHDKDFRLVWSKNSRIYGSVCTLGSSMTQSTV
uniref:Uncharacterized protein n=1 Tax=Oryza nivara TaxID=4536 RepID=A0A0E0IDK7_ORYNI